MVAMVAAVNADGIVNGLALPIHLATVNCRRNVSRVLWEYLYPLDSEFVFRKNITHTSHPDKFSYSYLFKKEKNNWTIPLRKMRLTIASCMIAQRGVDKTSRAFQLKTK